MKETVAVCRIRNCLFFQTSKYISGPSEVNFHIFAFTVMILEKQHMANLIIEYLAKVLDFHLVYKNVIFNEKIFVKWAPLNSNICYDFGIIQNLKKNKL